MSTVPNGSTTARRQTRVRPTARPATTSHTPRRERLTMEDGVKMFDLGVEIGQMRAGVSPQDEYDRGFREGFDASRLAGQPTTPLADAVQDWLSAPAASTEERTGWDGPTFSVRLAVAEMLALVGRNEASLSDEDRTAAQLAAACLLDALGVVPTDLY